MRTPTSILLLLLTALLPAAAGAEGGDWLTDVDEARRRAAESDRLLLVDLYADWCVWCKRLEQEVFSTPTFHRLARDFVLLRVDTEDGDEGTRLAARFGVRQLPTTLIVTPALARAGAVHGFAVAERYVARLRAEVERWRELERRYPEIAASSVPGVLRTMADELHRRRDGARAAELYARLLEVADLEAADELGVRYRRADSLRLAGHWQAAVEAAEELRRDLAESGAESGAGGELAESLDLLAFEIARDRGACEAATAALESFLERHPSSDRSAYARWELESLRRGGAELCA